MKNKNSFLLSPFHYSEFRHDIISGEWVLIAPERFHPKTFFKKKKIRVPPPSSQDPFKDPFKNVSENIILRYVKGKRDIDVDKKKWDILVLQNKFPAVTKNTHSFSHQSGVYSVVPGVGRHDLLITKNDKKDFSELSKSDAFHVFEAFRDRYLMFFESSEIAYVSIFHNWGSGAGASVFHPHYQIIGIPIIPPHVSHSFSGSRSYFEKNKKCAHCTIINWEIKQKKRIIAESKYAIAFAPFISRNSFEVRIFPKRHRAFFENTLDAELEDIASLLQKVLKKIKKNLNDPDYNFYIHTSPLKEKEKYSFYHWHIEILPRLNISAGFEHGTGIFINIVDPDYAARIIRS